MRSGGTGPGEFDHCARMKRRSWLRLRSQVHLRGREEIWGLWPTLCLFVFGLFFQIAIEET